MNTKVIHDVMAESQAGKLPFPQVVGRLIAEGVESYFIDLVKGEETFYFAGASTHVERMELPMTTAADAFSAAALVSAIRAAQADAIRFPEFLAQSAAAGVVAYWAFLTGRKVIYFGRRGELHVEEFPRAQ